MKFRVVCRKLYDYVRYDLKEIAFPSSLPDPPHMKKPPKLTWHDRWCILKEATRLYGASWVRDIGPELRPNDYKKEEEDRNDGSSAGSNSEKKGKSSSSSEPSLLEDLAVAARGGAETLKPALRKIYMTRASTYTNAMKNFVASIRKGSRTSCRRLKRVAASSRQGTRERNRRRLHHQHHELSSFMVVFVGINEGVMPLGVSCSTTFLLGDASLLVKPAMGLSGFLLLIL